MRSAHVFAAFAGCAAILAPSLASAQVALLREACLATEMDREAFERLADERDWEMLIRVVSAGNLPPDDGSWETMYRSQAGGPQFWMSNETPGANPSHATSCGVAATEPDTNWRSDLEGLAFELGMDSTSATPRPNSLEAGAWTTDRPDPVSLSYDLYRSGLTVRITRPSPAQ